jgi:hypothetical protein
MRGSAQKKNITTLQKDLLGKHKYYYEHCLLINKTNKNFPLYKSNQLPYRLEIYLTFSDVCNRIIPEIPNVSTRDPTYVMTNETSHWKFCDVYSINTSQWYRSETRMSTSCPSSMYMCGTKFPIWMNGKMIYIQMTLDDLMVKRAKKLIEQDCFLLHFTLKTLNEIFKIVFMINNDEIHMTSKYKLNVSESKKGLVCQRMQCLLKVKIWHETTKY